MEEDFDNTVGFWIKNIPYLWVQEDNIQDSKRFYLLKDSDLELFDEDNNLTDVTPRKNVGMRTPEDRRLSTSKETFSLIPVSERKQECRFVRNYFLVWTFSTREQDGKPILFKRYKNKKGSQTTRYNPWIHFLDIRIEGVRQKRLEPENLRNFEDNKMIVLENKESIRYNKTRTIRLRGYNLKSEPAVVSHDNDELSSLQDSSHCDVSPLMNDRIFNHIYYQDRKKLWPYKIPNETSYNLLCRMSKFVERLFNLNIEIMRKEYSDKEIKIFIKEGDLLYDQKPSLVKQGVTWSQNEYDHPGFHRAYIRYKSIQRFTETWAMLRRAHDIGILTSVYKDPTPRTIRIASLAGGPGLELYALREFFKKYHPHLKVECISLDLAGSWRPYAEELGIEFDVWDTDDGKGLPEKLGGKIDFAIISYALHMYMSKPHHIKWLSKAIKNETIPFVFVNSRMKNLMSHISEMRKEGIKEMDLNKLPDGRRDNRQFIYYTSDLKIKAPSRDLPIMFPDVPTMPTKQKGGKRRN